MSAFVSDTHTLVWYLANPKLLSPAAMSAFRNAALAGDRVIVPSISIVEVVYLVERFKLPQSTLERLTAGLADPDSALMVFPLDQEVALTLSRVSRDVVPDMPDRIIAATALHLNLPLVTRDAQIRASGIQTIW